MLNIWILCLNKRRWQTVWQLVRALSSHGGSWEVEHVTGGDLRHKFFEQHRFWGGLMICGLAGGNTSPGTGLEYLILYLVPFVFFCCLLRLWALKFLLLLQCPPLSINSVSPCEPWIPINTSNFFLWVTLVMVFCSSNGKETNTMCKNWRYTYLARLWVYKQHRGLKSYWGKGHPCH